MTRNRAAPDRSEYRPTRGLFSHARRSPALSATALSAALARGLTRADCGLSLLHRLRCRLLGRHEQAGNAIQLAISLDSSNATAHHWYAMSCLVPMGRLGEALEQMILAQSLDPVSSIVARDLALVHLFRRDFDAALEQCDHAIELNPHFSPAYWALGLVQEQRRDFDEAVAAFHRAIHLSPETPRMQAGLARTQALAGRKKEALDILRALETLSGHRYVSPFEFASMRFALGQTDLAFRWFNKACQDRSFELLWMRVDPRLDPIRGDRRFEAAVKQVGLAAVSG